MQRERKLWKSAHFALNASGLERATPASESNAAYGGGEATRAEGVRVVAKHAAARAAVRATLRTGEPWGCGPSRSSAALRASCCVAIFGGGYSSSGGSPM